MIGPTGAAVGRGPRRPGLALVAAAAAMLIWAGPAVPQAAVDSTVDGYTLTAPSGRTLALTDERVREMLARTRRLGAIVDRDPDVLYYVGSGPEVALDDPRPAYPWNAVRAENDSVARVAVPGNYRESRRAYFNYAVLQMERVRETVPAVRCTEAVGREVEAVSAFVDGWTVTRLLYGGPAYAPLDALVFAREAGHLSALVVAVGDTRPGGCRDRWRKNHPGEMEAYRRWRTRVFPPVDPGSD